VEKLIYPLWAGPQRQADGFRDLLLRELPPALAGVGGVRGVGLSVADSAVAAAAKRRLVSHQPAPDAMLSLWVDSACEAGGWETPIDALAARWCGYLVAEAEPLVSQRAHPSEPGERVYGMCQWVFMKRPEGLERDEWLAIWKGSHTQVAIETQSTFGYRQNVVVQTLGDSAIPCDAIVEEQFPPEAMESDHAFYASEGDERLLRQRRTAMMESCARFIDFAHIDVIPMSEYVIQHAAFR